MNERAVATAGRFVWHELLTDDPDRSRRFYAELFDWTVREENLESVGAYWMIRSGERQIGGMVPLDRGTASHWLSYATVEDVDEAARQTVELNGVIVRPPTDIPGVGRFCMVRDPRGVLVAPFKSTEEVAPVVGDAGACGTVCWNELITDDLEVSAAFHARLFGWSLAEITVGDMGTYHLLKRGDEDAGGVIELPPGAEAAPFWLPYVWTDDVDGTAERLGKLGGRIQVAPTDVPGIGRFAVGVDPTGTAIAMFRSAD